MCFLKFLILAFSVFFISSVYSQKKKSDSHIIGHVVFGNEHLPYASVSVKGTAIGTTTDETGHYQIINIPAGDYILKAQMMGYLSKEINVSIKIHMYFLIFIHWERAEISRFPLNLQKF